MVALSLPLLLVFVSGLHGLVERRGGAGADWSRLALAAGATLSAIFVLVNVLQIGLALSAGGLAEPTPAFEIVWQVHAAAFALALPTLGTTFIGAALAAHASGLTPAWQRLLGLVGGSLLLAAGLGNLAIADGSPLLFVGLLGFAAWLVWLLAPAWHRPFDVVDRRRPNRNDVVDRPKIRNETPEAGPNKSPTDRTSRMSTPQPAIRRPATHRPHQP